MIFHNSRPKIGPYKSLAEIFCQTNTQLDSLNGWSRTVKMKLFDKPSSPPDSQQQITMCCKPLATAFPHSAQKAYGSFQRWFANLR